MEWGGGLVWVWAFWVRLECFFFVVLAMGVGVLGRFLVGGLFCYWDRLGSGGGTFR